MSRSPSPSDGQFQRIVIDMAALLGSLMRWAGAADAERQHLEVAIARRRERVLIAMTALPTMADFALSAEVGRFMEMLPQGYEPLLRRGWLPDGHFEPRS